MCNFLNASAEWDADTLETTKRREGELEVVRWPQNGKYSYEATLWQPISMCCICKVHKTFSYNEQEHTQPFLLLEQERKQEQRERQRTISPGESEKAKRNSIY